MCESDKVYALDIEGEVTDECISDERADELIAEAEANGERWYIDLGEQDDGRSCNLLIIHAG